MIRVRRAVTLLVCFGAVIPAATGCAGMGNACGMLLNLVIGVGVAVGVYYLTDALK
jgi:hypothetical protein